MNWRRHTAGQPGVTGGIEVLHILFIFEGGQIEFDNALSAWNSNTNTPINYVDVGTTSTIGSIYLFITSL